MGDKIRALLAKRGWTIYRAAAETGLSTGHLHDLVTGKYEATQPTLRALAKGLGVPIGELLTPPDSKNCTPKTPEPDNT